MFKRNLIIWFIFLFLIPYVSIAQENKEMTANLNSIELKDFIHFVSEFTGKNIAFREDKLPETTISLHTQTPMNERALVSVLKSVLTSNSLELIERDGIYQIVTGQVAQFSEESVNVNIDSGVKEEIVTSVLQVDHRVPVGQVHNFLKPFLSQYGVAKEIPLARAILIRDTRGNIQRISELFGLIDDMSEDWDIKVVPLDKAKSSDIVPVMNSLFEDMVKTGKIATIPSVFSADWSNSIVIAGESTEVDMAKTVLFSLDTVSEKKSSLHVFPLKNAKAESAKDVLQELLNVDDEVVVSADLGTNSVLVLAESYTREEIKDIISHVDKPLSQVYVEALIMETSLEHSQDFGIEWSLGGGGSDGFGTAGFLSSDSRLSPLLMNSASNSLPGGFTLGALGNLITYGGNQFSTLGALVNFAKSATDFNIISTPQIMTLDNMEAEIFVGENRPFKINERVDPQNNVIQSFDYKDVGIRLRITPTINAETGMVRLAVEQEVKKVLNNPDNLAPTVKNRSTRTNVQLPSNSMMVISGLVEDASSTNKRAVPGVSNIPGIGKLFRSESSSSPKTTLMVFLNVKIIGSLDDANEVTKDKELLIKKTEDDNIRFIEDEFWGD